MAQCGGVDRRTQWAEVVMVADALKLPALAVEEEAFVGNECYAANAEARLVSIFQSAAGAVDFRHRTIE